MKVEDKTEELRKQVLQLGEENMKLQGRVTEILAALTTPEGRRLIGEGVKVDPSLLNLTAKDFSRRDAGPPQVALELAPAVRAFQAVGTPEPTSGSTPPGSSYCSFAVPPFLLKWSRPLTGLTGLPSGVSGLSGVFPILFSPALPSLPERGVSALGRPCAGSCRIYRGLRCIRRPFAPRRP